MSSRYEQLRSAIATLAAPPEAQAAYLCNQGLADGHGNDELALAFDDIFRAVADMRQRGELSAEQANAPKSLDALLDELSGEDNAAFWQRDALWTNGRWDEVRRLATQALAHFPELAKECD